MPGPLCQIAIIGKEYCVMATAQEAEFKRLTDYLDRMVAEKGGILASRARPEAPYLQLIAKEAGVARHKIAADNGVYRAAFLDHVAKHKLVTYDGWCGARFEQSDEIHARLIEYLHDRVAKGYGIPARGGKPNFKAVARGAGIKHGTLSHTKHKNRLEVERAFRLAGPGPERGRGALTIGEFLAALGG